MIGYSTPEKSLASVPSWIADKIASINQSTGFGQLTILITVQGREVTGVDRTVKDTVK